jgi:hypothetical protein
LAAKAPAPFYFKNQNFHRSFYDNLYEQFAGTWQRSYDGLVTGVHWSLGVNAGHLTDTIFQYLQGKNTMDNSSLIPLANHAMDFLLIAAAVWMAITVVKLRLGGALSSSVNRIVAGAMILGIAHVIETLSLQHGMEEHLNELVHRVIILAGFLALILGIQSLVAGFGKRSE